MHGQGFHTNVIVVLGECIVHYCRVVLTFVNSTQSIGSAQVSRRL
jgi:hypothetical protein